jgi:hypothetical protein
VWIADEPTAALRRQVTRRNQVVRQRSRLKNIIQSIPHSHLIPSCPHQDLCGAKERAWLADQVVPPDERLAIERHLREFDRLGEDLRVIEHDLARSALADNRVKRLMTIPGVNRRSDRGGEPFRQAAEARQLPWAEPQCQAVGPGACPSRPDHKTGPRPRPRHAGRGSMGSCAIARSAARFFLRVRARRGQHVAAVATGRKLAVVIWHLLTGDESYVWARPSLHARKLRDLELKAGHLAARGRKGSTHGYHVRSQREAERSWVEQAETAYTFFVANWNPRGPKKVRAGASRGERP